MIPTRTIRALEAVAACVVVFATLRFVLAHVGSLYDDAFIYFRYARVAREGCFYCFNPGGPRVEGITSPLYFLLVLGAASAGARYFVAATVIGGLAVAATWFVAASTALRRADSRVASMGAFVVLVGMAFDDRLQLNSVTGLETGLAMLLVTLVARSALEPSHRWLGLICFLATLVRPEAVLFVALLPVLPAMRNARRWAPPVIAFGLLSLARVALFNDFVPNTYRAKSGGSLQHVALGLEYLEEAFRGQPLIALAPAGLLAPRTREAAKYLLSAAALWLLFFLRSGGDHFEYGRLVAPLVPALVLVGTVGLLDRLATDHARWATPVACALVAGNLALASSHVIPEQHGFANVRRWIRLGIALREQYPGASLATVPVGAIAYYSRAQVIDLVGLTEPAIARSEQRIPSAELHREWLGHERFNTAWVLSRHPDIIVTTRWRANPWRSIDERRPGFYADRLLWEEIRAGRADYEVRDLEVTPDLHWLIYVRRR